MALVEEAIVTILEADATVGPLIAAHGMATATPIRFMTSNTLPTSNPAGFAVGTTYYARAVTATTYTVHATAADATGNLNIINLTDTGTGTHWCMYDNRWGRRFTTTVADATDIWTATSKRIYPFALPQGGWTDAIIYQRVSSMRADTIADVPDLARARMQITSWSRTYAAAKTLGRAVQVALNYYIGVVAGVTIRSITLVDEGDMADIEPGADEYSYSGVRQDYEVWFAE